MPAPTLCRPGIQPWMALPASFPGRWPGLAWDGPLARKNSIQTNQTYAKLFSDRIRMSAFNSNYKVEWTIRGNLTTDYADFTDWVFIQTGFNFASTTSLESVFSVKSVVQFPFSGSIQCSQWFFDSISFRPSGMGSAFHPSSPSLTLLCASAASNVWIGIGLRILG